jgi:hypothetical protein
LLLGNLCEIPFSHLISHVSKRIPHLTTFLCIQLNFRIDFDFLLEFFDVGDDADDSVFVAEGFEGFEDYAE